MQRVTQEINSRDAWGFAREIMLHTTGSRILAASQANAEAAESIQLGAFNALELLRCGTDSLGFRSGENRKYYFPVTNAAKAAAAYVADGLGTNYRAGYKLLAQYRGDSDTAAKFYVTTALFRMLAAMPEHPEQPRRPAFPNAKVNIRGEYVGRDGAVVLFYPPPAP